MQKQTIRKQLVGRKRIDPGAAGPDRPEAAATERVMESLLQLYGLAMVVLPVYAFVSLRNRIRRESLSKTAALVRYCGYVIAPVLGYAGVFAIALGVEAVSPLALVSEETARSFVLAMVLGVLLFLLASAVFAMSLLFVSGEGGRQRQ